MTAKKFIDEVNDWANEADASWDKVVLQIALCAHTTTSREFARHRDAARDYAIAWVRKATAANGLLNVFKKIAESGTCAGCGWGRLARAAAGIPVDGPMFGLDAEGRCRGCTAPKYLINRTSDEEEHLLTYPYAEQMFTHLQGLNQPQDCELCILAEDNVPDHGSLPCQNCGGRQSDHGDLGCQDYHPDANQSRQCFVGWYFKDRPQGETLLSGLPLPKDDDGVIRNVDFVNCNMHVNTWNLQYENCTFTKCDGSERMSNPCT